MDNDIQLFDKLLMLPLFQGLSREDLSEIVTHTKFGFHKFGKGKTVLHDGDVCDHLYFLMNGHLYAEHEADDHSYTIIEDLPSPNILQPEHLFGLSQRYSCTFVTKTNCSFITIDKNETMRLSDEFIVFRLNMLNLVSTKLQKIGRMPWKHQPLRLDMRIGRYIENRCLRPAGEKCLKIKMDRLAEELNETRRNISQALRAMEAKGLITVNRGEIHVPALEMIIKAESATR
jgi:CRP/FNR family cyclic AMP-dependent transcriptional regulator